VSKLGLTLGVLVSLCAVTWHNRVDLLVWGAPILRQVVSPVAENEPIDWASGPAVAEMPPADRPPNIILILTDDMGFNDISLHNGGAGDGTVLTPHIDALAHAGVTFANGYAANAICAPSRASLVTGRYSTRFGFEFTPVFRVGATLIQWMQDVDQPPLRALVDAEAARSLPPMIELGMPPEEVTIAEVLKDAGYYTAHIGKWHLGGAPGLRPEDQGFDDSLYMEGLYYLPEDHPDVVNARRDAETIDRMVWASAHYAVEFNGSEPFEPDGYLTDYFTREALRVIDNNRHRPFFLFLSHWGIHNPLQATRADYDRYAHIEDHHLRVYSAMIHSVDRSVGEIVARLAALGLDENTLIVFTSDNGGASYVQLADVNKPYRGWKLTHFEGGLHVPFMARWPARIQAGTVYQAPVHHVDVFQTIAAAAGASLPQNRKLDGVDLMPFVVGDLPGVPHETLFWRQGHQQTVLHNGWKLIRSQHMDKRWLFYLPDDPTERNDLAESSPTMVAELEALLDTHNAAQAPPMWPSVVDLPQRIDKHGGQAYEHDDEYIYWPN
tara:strand:- start:31001 stop:32656 length:1656 start_codon:yes stop_codon:yes gene_type:complete